MVVYFPCKRGDQDEGVRVVVKLWVGAVCCFNVFGALGSLAFGVMCGELVDKGIVQCDYALVEYHASAETAFVAFARGVLNVVVRYYVG